jgi:hypothetical protein
LVHVDQFGVAIAENGKPRRKKEKDRAPAQEWLIVPRTGRGEEFAKLGQELALAACPLEKWRGFHALT